MARKRNTEELRRYWTVDPRPAGKFHTFQEARKAWEKAGYPNRGGYAGISETAVRAGVPRVVRVIAVLDDQTGASTMAIANPSSDRADIIHAMARALYGRAWADREEEQGRTHGGAEIFDVMPTVWDPSALKAAKKLATAMEKANGKKLPALLALAETLAAKDRYAQAATAENFGHYAAMQAMDEGVGLEELGVRNQIKVPYVEYSYYEFADDAEVNPDEPRLATYRIGGDRYIWEVVEVSRTGHRVVAVDRRRRDEPRVFTRRPNGKYIEQGHKHGQLILDEAEAYLDPEF